MTPASYGRRPSPCLNRLYGLPNNCNCLNFTKPFVAAHHARDHDTASSHYYRLWYFTGEGVDEGSTVR